MTRRSNQGKRIWRTLGQLFFVSIIGLAFFQINGLVTQRCLAKEYKTKIDELSKENEGLQMNLIGKDYLEKVEDMAKELNFEKTEKVNYIVVLEPAVAVK